MQQLCTREWKEHVQSLVSAIQRALYYLFPHPYDMVLLSNDTVGRETCAEELVLLTNTVPVSLCPDEHAFQQLKAYAQRCIALLKGEASDSWRFRSQVQEYIAHEVDETFGSDLNTRRISVSEEGEEGRVY